MEKFSRCGPMASMARVALVLALGGPLQAAWASELLLPGAYHADEVRAVTGDQWLGVVVGDDGAHRLEPVALMVQRVFDPVLDAEGEQTGKKVSAVGHQRILFLVNDIPGLSPQPVVTAAENAYLPPNQPVAIDLGGEMPASLTLSCAEPQAQGPYVGAPCELVLQYRGHRSVLYETTATFENGEFAGTGSDAHLRLIWAGDLNGDAAPDLLLDLTDHYNVQQPTLLLSPASAPGEAPRKVAAHYSVGC